MQTSKKHLSDPLKSVLAVLLFLVFAIFVTLIITAKFDEPRFKDNDYDCLISGGSLPGMGIDSDIFDTIYNSKSIKMTTYCCTMEGRAATISDAIDKYPIDTVIMDISTQTLCAIDFGQTADHGIYTISELSKLSSKFKFFLDAYSFSEDQFDTAYGIWLDYGALSWLDALHDQPIRYWVTDNNIGADANDQTMSEEELETFGNTQSIDTKFDQNKVQLLYDTISLCQEKNIRIVMIVMPVSDRELFIKSGWNDYHNSLAEIAKLSGCEFYDFNLLKNKDKILNNENSFYDEIHLSIYGQDDFTKILGEIIQDGADRDVSDLFYNSYDQLSN